MLVCFVVCYGICLCGMIDCCICLFDLLWLFIAAYFRYVLLLSAVVGIALFVGVVATVLGLRAWVLI